MIFMYKNGNSFTSINSNDGTKERFTFDDDFNLEFPETLDICCTKKCSAGCPFCYESCTPNGKHADIMNAKFIDTLRPYTEVALQLNDLTHPDLIVFLEKIRGKNIFSNITINQIHFEQKENFIHQLVDKDLIKGIGISLRKPTPEFISKVKKFPNAVIHTINGILSASDIEAMRDQGLKLLILGYKNLGRGTDYLKENEINIKARQKYLYDVLETLPNHFKVVSFDNLALEQLDVKRIVPADKWDEIYLGDEGSCSMFIDLVTGKFGVSSLCKEDEMFPIMDNIVDMFKIVKQVA